MDYAIDLGERRTDSRFSDDTVASIRSVLRPGRVVSLVNLSAGGALVESSRPLRPGSNVYLQLASGTVTLGIAARVVRCAVAAIAAAGVHYHGALEFEPRCDSLWEQLARAGYSVPAPDAEETRADGHRLPQTRSRWQVGAARVQQ